MKILFCSSEVVPFAKTGGLADVAGTLPLALAEKGVKIKVVMPYYRMIDAKKFNIKKVNKQVSKAKLGKNVDIYFIESQRYFDRQGLYQDKGVDFPDNLERFAYYCQQVLALTKRIRFKPDVIHCNDWQTALIPLYLKTSYKNDQFFKNTRTVLTIHNLGYQGIFPAEQLPLTELPEHLYDVSCLEFYGMINLLKGGLKFCDKITTVSPTYAREMQTSEFGCGLEGVLRHRKRDITGILNGIDYDEWSPAKNKDLACQYDAESLEKKVQNKEDLQKLGKLKPDTKIPFFGIVTRLADQKGLNILTQVIDRVLKLPLQLILLGTGDPRYHIVFENVSRQYKNAAIILKFDPVLAYKIYAGSDIFLMPSYYEPCGLGQLISMSFGTIPLVRRTGGLADTVEDFDPVSGKGNGFVFDNYESGALLECIKRSVCVFNDKNTWDKIVRGAMDSCFPWEKSANEYIELYRNLLGSK